MMTEELLEQMLEAWLATMSPVDIARDFEKVALLKRVTEEMPGYVPTPFVRDLYRKVFLRDVWGCERCTA